MKRIMILTVAALMVMTLPSFAHANLLSNAGLEDGTWADDQSIPDNWWTGNGGGEWSGRAWSNNASQAHSGSKYLRAWGSVGGGYAYWGQSVSGITEGAVYDLSAYLKNEWGAASPYLKVEFKDASDAILRVDGGSTALTITGDWAQYTTTTDAAPSGTASANFVFYVQGVSDGGSIWIDDFDADVIPEPASLFLLGSGLVGLLGFSRRK